MSEIEDIKDRVDLVDLAKGYMTLRQAGRNFKAICPFHQEKTPSLMISADKQIWHCFGCGEGGDIFTLVQKMEGVDFYESLKILAQRAGVELKVSEGYRKIKDEVERQADINVLAAEFYHQAFLLSKSGEVARQYIAGRGLNKDMIECFKVGFAPDRWDELTKFLLKRGKKMTEMVAAGLGIYSRQGNVIDKFRNRVMFPIWNMPGKVTGFTGRVLRDEDNPKYLNTSTTKLFDKGRILYALNLAKDEIRKQKQVIVCEGQMDVISCHQFGFRNTVCSSGTAVTKHQLTLLKRMTDTILVAFDNDEAGRRAAYKLTGMALEEGFLVRMVDLKNFKDPDEMLRGDLTGWQKSVEQAVGFVDYFLHVFDKEKKEAKDKSWLADQIIPLIFYVKDEIEKGHYLSLLAEKLGVDERFVYDKYKSYRPSEKKKNEVLSKPETKLEVDERLVSLVICFFDILKKKINGLQVDDFSDKMKKVLSLLKQHEEAVFDWKWLVEMDSEDVKRLQTGVALVEMDYLEVDQEVVEREFDDLQKKLVEVLRTRQKDDLEKKIVTAEQSGDREKIKEYIRSLQDLIIRGK